MCLFSALLEGRQTQGSAFSYVSNHVSVCEMSKTPVRYRLVYSRVALWQSGRAMRL